MRISLKFPLLLAVAAIFFLAELAAQSPAPGFETSRGTQVNAAQGVSRVIDLSGLVRIPSGVSDFKIEIVRFPVAYNYPSAGFIIDGANKRVAYTAPPQDHTSDSFDWRAVDVSDASVVSSTSTLSIKITGIDDDGDTFPNNVDDFPDDACAYLDSDGDDFPDLLNPGQISPPCTEVDAFPLDKSEQRDTDGDGVGNNVDSDDDGDGIPDAWERDNRLDPLNPSDGTADTDLDGYSSLQEYLDGRSPEKDDYPPVFMISDYTSDSNGILTRISPPADVDNGGGQVADLGGGPVTVTPANFSGLLLLPGRHDIVWRAGDQFGNESTSDQRVDIFPKINLAEDAELAEGNSRSIVFYLGGEYPVYPVAVDFTISGSVDAGDFSLATDFSDDVLGSYDNSARRLEGKIVFTENQTERVIALTAAADNLADTGEKILVEITAIGGVSTSNRVGNNSSQTITVIETPQPPSFYFTMKQDGRETLVISRAGGDAVIEPVINFRPNGAILRYEWTFSDDRTSDVDPALYAVLPDGSVKLSTANFEPGNHSVSLKLSDNQAGSRTFSESTFNFQVLNAADFFTDSNVNGVDDDLEFYPDRKNFLLIQRDSSYDSFAYAPVYAFLSKGQYALKTGADFALVSETLLKSHFEANSNIFVSDTGFTAVDGIFDLNAVNLETGASLPIVIKLRNPLPPSPAFRFFNGTSWESFQSSSSDSVRYSFFVKGNDGICPEPHSNDYSTSPVGGERCVQFTIKDGGSLDATTNGKISLTGYFGSMNSIPLNAVEFTPPVAPVGGVSPAFAFEFLPERDLSVDSVEFTLQTDKAPSSPKNYRLLAYLDANGNRTLEESERLVVGEATFSGGDKTVRIPFSTPQSFAASARVGVFFTLAESSLGTSAAPSFWRDPPYLASGFGSLFVLLALAGGRRGIRRLLVLLCVLIMLSGCQIQSGAQFGTSNNNNNNNNNNGGGSSTSSPVASRDTFTMSFTLEGFTYTNASFLPPSFLKLETDVILSN